ncbi:class I SAM-dependent methyltransferase [Methylobacter sp.]|uniref:class I SAM-dependent methyltransferase n=1 Tax=Methylobacter sp. TaxID=2051955 RepID=UPI0012215E45|nr:class I SAM-dependent methyltransferase [Methylobacter sp.]TAK64230.1 MAG: class I SAM-dependent methyltransferase [Methylobacter sp.]
MNILFDQPYYLEINEARWESAEKIISSLPKIKTCIDAGCGPGWFAERLAERELVVFGIDGRAELTEEARRRVPKAIFSTIDITSLQAAAFLPKADLVFCFGLLYHLENPFAAIRALYQASNRFLLIETQIAPEEGAGFQLVSEGQNETQGLTYHALIPSRKALVKMLYVAGFSHVMRYTGKVNHIDFNDSLSRRHRREIFLASRESGAFPDFVHEDQPVTPKIDYTIKP